MDVVQSLPLPVEALPEGLRRFADPSGPGPARLMAAKGLVPVKGGDLVTLLVQLSFDPEATIAAAARGTLEGVPEGVLYTAAEAPLHPSILDGLHAVFGRREDVVERIAANIDAANETIAAIARGCSERIAEIVATNQQRLLGAPKIIENLYLNKNTRMSTVDRLVELAARNGVELTGIPTFAAHVEAIQGQLIPEPTDEPLPTDQIFQEAIEADDDEAAVEIDSIEQTETLKNRFRPLAARLREMNVAEKLRMAMVGDLAARAILVRDPNRQVSQAAISSPQVNEAEATSIAHSREIGEDILRYIANRREWLRSYELKRALVFNPKTPVGISMRFLSHLRPNDLKVLARSRGIPGPLKSVASQRLAKQQTGKGNK